LQEGASDLFTPEQLQPVATDIPLDIIVNPQNAESTGDNSPAAPVNNAPTTAGAVQGGGVLTSGANAGGGNGGSTSSDSSGGGVAPVPPPVTNGAENGSSSAVALLPTPTPTEAEAAQPAPEPPTPEPPAPTPELPAATPEPPTPAPEPPAPTPEPPTPEPPTPEPVVIEPTATPTEAPPPAAPIVAAAACGDARSLITAPGNGQIVGGVVNVSGNATHESFQYYKLEYAQGAAAGGGFVYFDGGSNQVAGGLLGSLESRALPNGEYTIRLTVVDQTGNFPAPCDVSMAIQN
jgi:hypothetical protein